MNQVNHDDIQHEWFMTYIVYAMNVQAHERMKERDNFRCETPKIQAQQSCVFGVFVLFNYDERDYR